MKLSISILICVIFSITPCTEIYSQEINIPICPAPPQSYTRDGNILYSCYKVDFPPRFKSRKLEKEHETNIQNLRQDMESYIKRNFQTSQFSGLGLLHKQWIYVKFEIDTLGKAQNINARANHPNIEKETIYFFEQMPDFIPAEHKNKRVFVEYIVPIIFEAQP